MFLATWDWALAIGLGLVIGVIFATRKKYDFSQIILLKPDEFRLNMRKGQLLDIRSEADFTKGRINGSRNFPKRTMSGNLYKFRTDQPVFLYDQTNSGLVRSLARKLIKKGFHPVYLLEDGFVKWPFSIKED